MSDLDFMVLKHNKEIKDTNTTVGTHTTTLATIVNLDTIVAVANVFTIDMAGKQVRNVKLAIADNAAKEIVVINPTVGCEIYAELTFTDGGAVTYPMSTGSTSKWLTGSAPSLADGKVYPMAFIYYATNIWHNHCPGGW